MNVIKLLKKTGKFLYDNWKWIAGIAGAIILVKSFDKSSDKQIKQDIKDAKKDVKDLNKKTDEIIDKTDEIVKDVTAKTDNINNTIDMIKTNKKSRDKTANKYFKDIS